MGRLRTLILKEFKELAKERTVLLGVIIMPLIIFSVLGAIQGYAFRQMGEAAVKPVNLAIAPGSGASPEDVGLARTLAKLLNATFLQSLPKNGPAALLSEGYEAVIVVPPGASENLTSGQPALVQVYVARTSPSFIEESRVQSITQRIEGAGRVLLAAILAQAIPGIKPETIASPIITNVTYYMAGRPVTPQELQGVMSAAFFIPLAFLIMLVSAAQVAATSIGLEREAKTLEMLLSSPISHREIVVSKVAGTTGVTMLGILSFGAGFGIYYNSVQSALREVAQAAGGEAGISPVINPAALIAIAPALAATLYLTVVIGLIIGMTANDVRGAQLAASQATFILLLPYIAAFMGLIPSVTGKGALLLADPLYPVYQVSLSVIMQDKAGLAYSYAALAGHTVLWTLLAAKLLSPEALLSGYNLKARLERLRGSLKAPRTGLRS